MSKELTIKEGTISFWLKEKSINFKDDSVVKLCAIDPVGGSILIIKDSDGMIKAFFVIIGKGRINAVVNASDLDETFAHLITFTWSETEICLYIDGDLRNKKELLFY